MSFITLKEKKQAVIADLKDLLKLAVKYSEKDDNCWENQINVLEVILESMKKNI